MTGDLVKAIRACPQPVVAAIDGVCVGAGACLAAASDLRIATPEAKTAFLFVRVGLAGCDMGACALLPRIIGAGRASELLLTGRTMGAEEASAGGSSTGSARRTGCSRRRSPWPASWPRVRPSPI
jgi:enoyl-CoA hydratase/carnithine racemase